MKNMNNKGIILGQLLKSADSIQMFYYENRDLVKQCPKVLIGSSNLITVSRNPSKGIQVLKSRLKPFEGYLLTVIKRELNEHNKAKFLLGQIKNLLKEAEEICAMSLLTDKEKYIMFFNYLKY